MNIYFWLAVAYVGIAIIAGLFFLLTDQLGSDFKELFPIGLLFVAGGLALYYCWVNHDTQGSFFQVLLVIYTVMIFLCAVESFGARIIFSVGTVLVTPLIFVVTIIIKALVLVKDAETSDPPTNG